MGGCFYPGRHYRPPRIIRTSRSYPAGYLKFSESQKGILDGWKRLHELQGGFKILPKEEQQLDLVQDVITDCSIVASLCSAFRREQKGFGQTIRDIIYPQNEKGEPTISPSGKYIIKLFFNGCYRKVVIDDFLPVSTSGRKLCVTCRENPTVFGPALIEKAYLKIMGGYEFPGSNSGSDLLALTGWIPEHVFLQSEGIVLSALWKRISKAWASGDVLVTLGTGRMTSQEESELGLIGEHDYAVLELKDDDRMMKVKNPWLEGTVWKGILAAPNHDDDNDEDFDAPTKTPVDIFDVSDFKDALDAEETLQPGIFWISLENVCRNFASLYLNWNPSLFTYVHETHFSWDLSTKVSETSFGGNPQFSLSNPSQRPTTVWILLSRHLGLANENCEGPKKNGFISLYLFDSSGNRVYLSSPSIHRTPYVDSPHTLLCLDELPPKTTYTLVVSSQDLPSTIYHFSLAIYSLSAIGLESVIEAHPYSLALSSSWSLSTSGGNAQSPSYPQNPQFLLNIPSGAKSITLLLETRSLHPVHVKLVHSAGKRVSSITTRDIIAESGEYKCSTALAAAYDLPVGKYTVVASTFEPGQLGAFNITLLSTAADVTFNELPGETAGCFETVIHGLWPPGTRKLSIPMEVGRLMKLWIKARTTTSHSRALPSLRLRVIRPGRHIGQTEEDLIVLSSSDAFEDIPMGVRTGSADLGWADGGYLIVLERLGVGMGEGWEVTVISEGQLWVSEEAEPEDDGE